MSSEEFDKQKADTSRRFYIDDMGPDEDGWRIVDRATGADVGYDGGEPEDQILVRDWAWVADALNQVEAERRASVERLTRERDAAVERATLVAKHSEEEIKQLVDHAKVIVELRDDWKRRAEVAESQVDESTAREASLREACELAFRISGNDEISFEDYNRMRVATRAALAVPSPAAEELLAKMRRYEEAFARLDGWTHRYGSELVPSGADTYGEGVRDAKDAVRLLLRAALDGGKGTE